MSNPSAIVASHFELNTVFTSEPSFKAALIFEPKLLRTATCGPIGFPRSDRRAMAIELRENVMTNRPYHAPRYRPVNSNSEVYVAMVVVVKHTAANKRPVQVNPSNGRDWLVERLPYPARDPICDFGIMPKNKIQKTPPRS